MIWQIKKKEISQKHRQMIKSKLLELALSAPALLQKQIAEAVTEIAKCDFWENWKTLLP